MTTVVADTRVELAAAILAGWSSVRSRLADEPVRVGRVEQQAHRAFTRTGSAWQAFAEPGARRLAGDLHADYSAQLGALIDSAASKGLAVGVDLQLAKGVSPEVAWQRALVGYGLDEAGMRWFVNGAMKAAADGSGGTVSAAMRNAVTAAILGRADHLADIECRAWEGAHEAIAKAYNPREPRDEKGQWARVTEREAFTLPPVAPETPEPPDRYAAAQGDRYAAARGDRYAAAQGDRYAAAQGDRYEEAARNARYAVDTQSAAREARYVRPEPDQHFVKRTIILAIPQKRGTPPGTPPPPSGTFMIPLDDMDDFFRADGRVANIGGFDHDRSGAFLDFGHLRRAYEGWGDKKRIEAQHTVGLTHLPIHMMLPEVDENTWEDLVHEATRLHYIVADDPLEWAKTLQRHDEFAYDEVWKMVSSPGLPNRLIDHLEEDDKAIKYGLNPPNQDMVDALADYLAWVHPDLIDEDGARFYDTLRESSGHKEDRSFPGYTDEDLDFSRIPAVVNFPEGLDYGDDASDMQGKYRIRYVDGVQYVSGIRTGGSARMNGHIGVQMINLVPDDDRTS